MGKRWQVLIVFAAVMTTLAGTAGVQAQGPALSRVMREKLLRSQGILDAVVTSNWRALESHTRELEQLTTTTGWTVLRYPEYAKESSAFVDALRDLRRVAELHDSDKATEAYVAVVHRCVGCHKQVARSRMAS